MTTKRFRKPKLKDGELRMYWGKLPGDCPDIIYSWQGEHSMKYDSRFLHYALSSEKPDPFVQPIFSKMLPSFTDELIARGYDITTLKFSIMKKKPND
jgi:hypothetical protein